MQEREGLMIGFDWVVYGIGLLSGGLVVFFWFTYKD